MRASLYLLKKQNGRTEFTMKTDVQIVVVDLDRSKNYPLNFLCIFPQTIISPGKHSNLFGKIFGTRSLEVARTLLQKALRREKDAEIRKELTKRLKLLKSTLTDDVMTTD